MLLRTSRYDRRFGTISCFFLENRIFFCMLSVVKGLSRVARLYHTHTYIWSSSRRRTGSPVGNKLNDRESSFRDVLRRESTNYWLKPKPESCATSSQNSEHVVICEHACRIKSIMLRFPMMLMTQ
jgi:hypothetical protein